VLDSLACGQLHAEGVTHRLARLEDAPDALTNPGPMLIFTPDQVGRGRRPL
jgi:hypothetical protein